MVQFLRNDPGQTNDHVSKVDTHSIGRGHLDVPETESMSVISAGSAQQAAVQRGVARTQSVAGVQQTAW